MEATLSERPPLRFAFVDALDRPAREAILLGERPLWATAGIGLAGAALVALASILSLALDTLHLGAAAVPKVDLLRAMFEAMALVIPSVVVLSGYFGLGASPKTVLAAVALGLLIAGVVSTSTLPLMAYLTFYSKAKPLVAPGALVPVVALATIASTSGRVLRSIDPTRRSRALVLGMELGLAAVFIARASGL
jgi:hypothetical protein